MYVREMSVVIDVLVVFCLSYFSDCWKTTVNVYSNNIQNCFIAVLPHLL
jgi:hypothetical protein